MNRSITVRRAFAAALAAFGLHGAAAAQALLDWTPVERQRIAAHGPWPPDVPPDRSNALEGRSAAIELGRRLFGDPALSADGQTSCASCHDPATAFQDNRRTPKYGTRNTPTLLDVAQQRWFGWDGGNDSLWAASLKPMLQATEMGPAEPQDASPDLVKLAKALAAYQATLVSPRTPFDDFRDALARGDLRVAARYPLGAQRGLRLFIGEGRCTVCHSGPRFSNGEFADIGVPFFLKEGGVDGGRHAGLKALAASPHTRLGPFNDAGAARDLRAVTTRHLRTEPRHFGEFRVPGLRQLAHTAPYLHDGSAPTLAAVVRHYSELNEERLHADGERILRPLRLSPQQAADLEAFLASLSASASPSTDGVASPGRARARARAPRP
jgi:cytochrome c peroxidase